MDRNRLTSDVFLSYSAEDFKLAAEIARVLQSFDLSVWRNTLTGGDLTEEAIWEAMAESQAFVIIVSNAPLSAWTMFELGAAQGWNKPIYVVVTDPATIQLPSFLQGLPVYPPSRIEELALEIKSISAPLKDAETSVLIQEFARIGEPLDQLLMQPALLAKLTKQFKKRARRQAAPEELLRTLLRLRKRGELPTTTRKSRAG